jgi:hypothetical protein
MRLATTGNGQRGAIFDMNRLASLVFEEPLLASDNGA